MPLSKMLLAGGLILGLTSAAAAQDAATVGTGGSAAAGGTSASTVGTGGASTGADGSYGASVASGGSAAAVDGRATSRTQTNANPNNLQTQSRASAQDGGTFSKSRTKTKVNGDNLSSTTRIMSHEPGQKPVIQRSASEAQLGQ